VPAGGDSCGRCSYHIFSFVETVEADVLDSGEEEFIAEFAERIQYLYEELVRLGYLS